MPEFYPRGENACRPRMKCNFPSYAAGSGRDLASGDLLALQAGVYRYSEAVDLSAKLVDRATSGVKTVIQGQ